MKDKDHLITMTVIALLNANSAANSFGRGQFWYGGIEVCITLAAIVLGIMVYREMD